MFTINGEVLGVEGFGCHETFKAFFEKLVKKYYQGATSFNLKSYYKLIIFLGFENKVGKG